MATSKWYVLSSQSRKDHVEMIYRTELEINDSIYTMGQSFTENDKGFYIEQPPARELPYDNLM